MIKAVLLVLAIAIVVTAIVVLVNFANKKDLPKDTKKQKKLKFDGATGVYYDDKTMTREAKDGVVSFRSKEK